MFRDEKDAERSARKKQAKQEKRARLEKEAKRSAAKKMARGGMLWDSATGEIKKEEPLEVDAGKGGGVSSAGMS